MMTMQTDLDLNYKKLRSGGPELLRGSVGGVVTGTALDLGGFALYRPKLGNDLDLDGSNVKDGGATLFGGTNGQMTLQSDLNLNGQYVVD